jgi:hypothetical protein
MDILTGDMRYDRRIEQVASMVEGGFGLYVYLFLLFELLGEV